MEVSLEKYVFLNTVTGREILQFALFSNRNPQEVEEKVQRKRELIAQTEQLPKEKIFCKPLGPLKFLGSHYKAIIKEIMKKNHET